MTEPSVTGGVFMARDRTEEATSAGPERADLLCPSADEKAAGARIIGVVQGSAKEPRLKLLREPLPVGDDLLRLAAPVHPSEVFRTAAYCSRHACVHYSRSTCTLARRIVDVLPEVAQSLPTCAIRSQCRWFDQEGGAACRRCPQIVRYPGIVSSIE